MCCWKWSKLQWWCWCSIILEFACSFCNGFALWISGLNVKCVTSFTWFCNFLLWWFCFFSGSQWSSHLSFPFMISSYMCFNLFAVELPSIHLKEQKDLHSPSMVQGSSIFSRKLLLYLSVAADYRNIWRGIVRIMFDFSPSHINLLTSPAIWSSLCLYRTWLNRFWNGPLSSKWIQQVLHSQTVSLFIVNVMDLKKF